MNLGNRDSRILDRTGWYCLAFIYNDLNANIMICANLSYSLIVVSANLRDIMNIIMKNNPSLITAERCFW